MGDGVSGDTQGYSRSDFLNPTSCRYLADVREITPQSLPKIYQSRGLPSLAEGIQEAVSHEILHRLPPGHGPRRLAQGRETFGALCWVSSLGKSDFPVACSTLACSGVLALFVKHSPGGSSSVCIGCS